jgi:hypothetical protein
MKINKPFEVLCMAHYNRRKNVQCWQHCFPTTIMFRCCLSSLLIYPHSTGRFLLLEPSVLLTLVSVTELFGSASKFVFCKGFWEITEPSPHRIARIGGFVFCDWVVTTILEFLSILSLESSYNYVSLNVIIDTGGWLYCVWCYRSVYELCLFSVEWLLIIIIIFINCKWVFIRW